MPGLTSRLHILALLSLALFAVSLSAQTTYPIEGYIGAVHSAADFEVNGRRFEVSSATSFGLIGVGSTSTSSPLRNSLRVGIYVQVAGSDAGLLTPIKATTVLIRDDWGQKLSGTGVVTRVALPPAPTAVYEADGYLVRITSSTKLTFLGDLDSLADIGPNVWIHFSGKRDKNGIVDAAKAQFIPAKPTKFKAVPVIEINTVKAKPASATGNDMTSTASGTITAQGDGATLEQDEQMKIGPLGRWHTIPADLPLQQRVHNVGMSVVPRYQRELAESDPTKIHFRFFAIDDPKTRTEINLLDGVILIPRQVVERLNSDDQLAAVLADGVAYNLQRQAAKVVAMNRAALGAEIAADIAGAFVPGMGSAILTTTGVAGEDAEIALQEERLRIGLALMHDAGYNPWQAPQAWRLLASKKPPANVASLPYPDASCYQVQVLNLQYAQQ